MIHRRKFCLVILIFPLILKTVNIGQIASVDRRKKTKIIPYLYCIYYIYRTNLFIQSQSLVKQVRHVYGHHK